MDGLDSSYLLVRRPSKEIIMADGKKIPMGTLLSIFTAIGITIGGVGTGAIFYGDTRWELQDNFVIDLVKHGEDIFVTAKQFERWEMNQLRREIQELEWEETANVIVPKKQALLDFLRLQLKEMEDAK